VTDRSPRLARLTAVEDGSSAGSWGQTQV